MLRRDNAAWERFGASDEETPSDIYARRRKLMIDAERERVVEIRDTGKVAHEVVDEVLSMLDIEESMLDYSAEERERVRAGGNAISLEGGCEHLQEVAQARRPRHPRRVRRLPARWAPPGCTCGCACICGHIACCDSSPERHASAHHTETGHEVMRSAEAGEDWRWCFVDQLTG